MNPAFSTERLSQQLAQLPDGRLLLAELAFFETSFPHAFHTIPTVAESAGWTHDGGEDTVRGVIRALRESFARENPREVRRSLDRRTHRTQFLATAAGPQPAFFLGLCPASRLPIYAFNADQNPATNMDWRGVLGLNAAIFIRPENISQSLIGDTSHFPTLVFAASTENDPLLLNARKDAARAIWKHQDATFSDLTHPPVGERVPGSGLPTVFAYLKQPSVAAQYIRMNRITEFRAEKLPQVAATHDLPANTYFLTEGTAPDSGWFHPMPSQDAAEVVAAYANRIYDRARVAMAEQRQKAQFSAPPQLPSGSAKNTAAIAK